MIVEIASEDVDRFRALIGGRLGLSFEEAKSDFLARVLRDRAALAGCAKVGDYLGRLAAGMQGPAEWGALIEELTVTETYFFRYGDHFRAFVETVLPSCLAARAPGSPVRILSAGCASGEEPYSLAILSAGAGAEIRAIDVNPAMIGKARQARYSPWSLRDTPADVRDRHFAARGRDFALDDRIRERVSFEERNLLDPDLEFWAPDSRDVVFCRNVIMYFAPRTARAVVARIAQALRPGGFLFLGHAETLRGISDAFHLRHTQNAFYYQKKGAGERSGDADGLMPALIEPASAASNLPPDSGGAWVEAIERASRRIASLAADRAAVPPAAEPRERAADVGSALDLLRRERFGEALDTLRALPPAAGATAEALLLRAVLLTNTGDLPAAGEACRELLRTDELSAGAHYLMALCREHGGDRRAAADHDQTALYLDPAFAMPRLHLGLLARKDGDPASARRLLGEALGFLAKEDPARVLLFGGGFGREALIELCRRELRACGGVS